MLEIPALTHKAQTIAKPMASSNANTEKAFEAMVAGFFVDALMPDNADGLFAVGTGHSVWSSMLSQQIGAVLSESGVLNLKTSIAEMATYKADQSNALNEVR